MGFFLSFSSSYLYSLASFTSSSVLLPFSVFLLLRTELLVQPHAAVSYSSLPYSAFTVGSVFPLPLRQEGAASLLPSSSYLYFLLSLGFFPLFSRTQLPHSSSSLASSSLLPSLLYCPHGLLCPLLSPSSLHGFPSLDFLLFMASLP